MNVSRLQYIERIRNLSTWYDFCIFFNGNSTLCLFFQCIPAKERCFTFTAAHGTEIFFPSHIIRASNGTAKDENPLPAELNCFHSRQKIHNPFTAGSVKKAFTGENIKKDEALVFSSFING